MNGEGSRVKNKKRCSFKPFLCFKLGTTKVLCPWFNNTEHAFVLKETKKQNLLNKAVREKHFGKIDQ